MKAEKEQHKLETWKVSTSFTRSLWEWLASWLMFGDKSLSFLQTTGNSINLLPPKELRGETVLLNLLATNLQPT